MVEGDEGQRRGGKQYFKGNSESECNQFFLKGKNLFWGKMEFLFAGFAFIT